MTHDASPRAAETTPDPEREGAKWDAYAETILEFRGPPVVAVDLRAPLTAPTRRALRTIVGGERFAVFTAENPAGRNVEDAPSDAEEARRAERNEQRRSQLEGELDSLGVRFVAVDGVAADGDYRERCAAALMDREDAAALARRYGQLALFWFDGDRFWVVPGIARRDSRPLP
jgi:hypothetical protein